ncbi:hypothetical protein [Facilibium subflavum]|uniref:hypothetical protein n=1 Tax=Facilibium subflavum TaxID=2219058 RepID=UPI000E65DD95|nr:hypothetical protein [Facilibium subflavum]
MQTGNTGISAIIQADKRLKQIRKYKRRWILTAVFLPIIIFLLLIISKVSLPIDANVLGFVIAIILVIVIPVIAATSAISVMIVYIMLHFFYKKEIGKLESTIKQNPEAYRQLQSIKAEQSTRLKAARRKLKARHIIYCLLVVVFVIALIVSLILYYQARQNQKIAIAGQHVVKLLEKKYHQPFEIASGRYESNLKVYEFQAYPKGNPWFDFTVWSSGPNSTRFRDGYLNTRNSFEAWQMVKGYITAISDKYAIVGIGVGTLHGDEAALSDLHKNQLHLDQWVANHGSKLGFGVRIYFNFPITPESKQRIFNQTYKMIKFLQNKKFGRVSIRFQFFNLKDKDIKALEKKWRHALPFQYEDNYIAGLGIHSKRLRKDPQNLNANEFGYVTYNDLDKIHSPDDIAQFFHQYNIGEGK